MEGEAVFDVKIISAIIMAIVVAIFVFAAVAD
jgi:hypothetical protein